MMNRQILLVSTLIAAATASSLCVAANAMPVVAIDQCAGLLGSPIAQLPIQDPLIQEAIDVIKSKQLQPVEPKLPTKPEPTVSHSHKKLDGVLILGGAESIPM